MFNLGHHRTYSLLEFIEILRRYCEFEYRQVPFPAESERIDIGDYWADIGKFNEAVGWKPRIDLDEGLERTVEFFRRP